MHLDVVLDKCIVLQELYVLLTQRGGFDCTVQRCGAVAKQVVEPEGNVRLGRRTGEGCMIDFWDRDWKGVSAGQNLYGNSRKRLVIFRFFCSLKMSFWLTLSLYAYFLAVNISLSLQKFVPFFSYLI